MKNQKEAGENLPLSFSVSSRRPAGYFFEMMDKLVGVFVTYLIADFVDF